MVLVKIKVNYFVDNFTKKTFFSFFCTKKTEKGLYYFLICSKWYKISNKASST